MSTTNTDIESIYTTSDPNQFLYHIDSDDGEEEYSGTYQFEEETKLRTEDFISRPYMSPKCDIEENILEFDFSYGYDCKKPYNLVVMDEKTICFASGNLIHIFDVESRDIWFRRSALGGGIGHMTKNPNPEYPHLAIGENGNHPPIIIYHWPSLEIITLLKGGTSRIFTHLDYSPSGDLLASQGGEPDYLITIWNWPKSTILLRTKSYMNDVLRVMFSPFVPGQLTTSGIAHIKFWKLARTFTGLKLQGELGRFGKTEYSDIVGIYPMPDEKVISGCFWGNILVWDEGLIKLEVCRKNRKRCHEDAIVQFEYQNGELWTVSLDGHVKMWFYDTIDQLDPPDDDRFCLMEPTYDFHTPGAKFMCIRKQFADPNDTFYFAQDAKGAIWRIDLNIEAEHEPSERLLKSHAGLTMGMAVCPWGPYFVSIGIGGWLHLYNYELRKLLVITLFPAPGASLLWVPLSVDPSGEVVILAFGDGSVRVGVWKISDNAMKESGIHIIQVEKPHCLGITCISLNKSGSLLITGGEDKTIFVFQVSRSKGKYIKLIPIGYVPTPDVPSCLTWNRHKINFIIVGCIHGQIMSVELPLEPVDYTTITYILKVNPIYQRFHTYKSLIHRDQLIKEIEHRKQLKIARKLVEIKKIRAENPGIDIDEEMYLEDSESTEQLPPLYEPEVPNKIFWIMHTDDDTLWLSMDGYDAGYIYEYQIGQTDPIPFKCFPVEGAADTVIGSYIFSSDKDYIIFGMLDGSIRVNKVNKSDWHDLSNYWQLNMHDNCNGYISGMSFTYDNSYFITSGHDGNIFAFRFYPENETTTSSLEINRKIPNLSKYEFFDTLDCKNKLSLEQTIVKKEKDRIKKVADYNKDLYLRDIEYCRQLYEDVLARNSKLPPAQQFSMKELVVDPRVTEDLERILKSESDLLKRKYEFNVEKSKLRMKKLMNHFINCMDVYPIVVKGIKNEQTINTIKERALGDFFFQNLEEVERRIWENRKRGWQQPRATVYLMKPQTPKKPEKKLEYFLVGLSEDILKNKLTPKMLRLLAKYRARNDWKENRKHQWDTFNKLKPAEASTDSDDEDQLREAEETIGDYKLKSAADYKVPSQLRESTCTKFKQLLQVRKKGYDMVHEFNQEVYGMRERKKKLYEFLKRQANILRSLLHEELEPKHRLPVPDFGEITDEDFPEKVLEINESLEEKVAKAPQKELYWSRQDMVQRAVLTIPIVDPLEEEEKSAWEKELQNRRYRRKLFEQDQMFANIKKSVDNFNNDLNAMRYRRVEVGVASCLNLLHLITLNQELIVLKECEAKEDSLSEEVNQKLKDQMDTQDVFNDLKNRLNSYKAEVEHLEEAGKEISKTFYVAINDSKFFDFLRRIFRKKYKPPKGHTDDDSDSSSSSSSSDESEEEDAASIDSKDFGIVRLDENICPKGCDLNTYEMTFQMRAQRHEVEHKIKDLQSLIEATLKMKRQVTKKHLAIAQEVKTAQKELEEFQREKQKKLNEIMCTVILKADQIKNLKETEETATFNYIRNSLLFSSTYLTQLYRRVSGLDQEKNEQVDKHKLSVLHLKRMHMDIMLMQKKIGSLKRDIKRSLARRFGNSNVAIKEIEEYMLKKMIFDLRLSTTDFQQFFETKLRKLDDVQVEIQKETMSKLRKNTLAQELLSVLRYERASLAKALEHQHSVQRGIDKFINSAEDMTQNIKKLEKVLKDQKIEMEMLKNEIQIYKTKGFRKPSKKTIEKHVKDEESVEDESVVSEWGENDDYMFTETYAKEFWAQKQINQKLQIRQRVIMGILEDLFKNINMELDRNVVTSTVRMVFSDISNKCDVNSITSNLVHVISSTKALSDQQISLIELTAEKLYSVEDTEELIHVSELQKDETPVQKRMVECTNDILEHRWKDLSEMIETLVHALIANFPLPHLLVPSNLDSVVNRIVRKHPHFAAKNPYNELMEFIEMRTLEGRIILEEIVDKIFVQRSSGPEMDPESYTLLDV